VSQPDLLLLYDRQCPVCDAYCRTVSVRDGAGSLRLVDAREDTEVRREVTARGLDIDQGMVLKVGDAVHYGSDAIHALARISARRGAVNRLSRWLFGSARSARFFYPPLRAARNLLLTMLRRTKINNLQRPGVDRF
jgi:predicted DCC family thiol-disulfide oxidoreductase YuxK